MKKILFFAAAVASLVAVSCQKPEEKPDPKEASALESISFLKADNEFLPKDFVFESPVAEALSLSLPYTVLDEDLKAVKVHYTLASEEATLVYEDGTLIEDGASLNLSAPVEIFVYVRDEAYEKDLYTKYTLSASISSAPTWAKVAESSIDMGTAFVMKINPKNGLPYLLGYKDGTDADGKLNNDLKQPVLFKLNGNALEPVTGNVLRERRCDNFGLDFDKNGNAVVAFGVYEGASVANATMVMKVTDSKADSLSFLEGKYGGYCTTNVPVVAVDDNDNYVGFIAGKGVTGVGQYGLYFGHHVNNEMSQVALDGFDVQAKTYHAQSLESNGTKYLMALQYETHKFFFYKLNGGNWDKMFDSPFALLKADGSEITDSDRTNQGYAFDFDSKGNLYLFAYANFTSDAKLPAVVKHDFSNNTQSIIGGVISGGDDANNGGFLHSKVGTTSMALDANDVPYVVFANNGKGADYPSRVVYIDPKTKTWAEPIVLSNDNIKGAQIAFNNDGVGYIGLFNASSKKYEIYSTVTE